MASKISNYYTLRRLIFGMPKYYSNFKMIVNALYLIYYTGLSAYSIYILESTDWTYEVVLILSIISLIVLLMYYLTSKSSILRKKLKNTKTFLNITIKLFKLTFLTSNIMILLSYSTDMNASQIVALILSSLYLVYTVITILIGIVTIIIRLINFRKYIPLLKNKELVESVANDINKEILDAEYSQVVS